VRIAYADPPYPGCAHLYGCDEVNHADLIDRLYSEFPDGWALSTSSPALAHVLPLCRDGVRVAAWVKPFASFKPNVNPAYAWEPVLFHGGRKRERYEETVRDWCSVPITLKRGLTGAKPAAFCHWLFALLGARPSDEFVDLYPGTGSVTDEWNRYCLTLEAKAARFIPLMTPLFPEAA
jgi:hypothetical protein